MKRLVGKLKLTTLLKEHPPLIDFSRFPFGFVNSIQRKQDKHENVHSFGALYRGNVCHGLLCDR